MPKQKVLFLNRIVLMVLCVVLIMPIYKISAQEYTWNNIYSLEGSQFIYVKDNNYILISKKDGKSNVVLKSNDEWKILFKDIPDIRSVFEYNGEIYILSSKDNNRAVYKSTDSGNTWNNILGTEINFPNNIGNNNVESIVLNNDSVYINVNKQGIFVTYDKGNNWTILNNGLPTKNQTEVLSRNIWTVDGELYVSTKDKNGLYKYHKDEGVWKPVKNLEGLPTGDSREVRDFVIYNSKIYIGTNNGVWFTSIDGNDSWSQVNGISGDVRRLMVMDGNLYAISKSARQIYMLNNSSFESVYSTTDSTLGDFFDIAYLKSEESFLVAHSKGLVMIKNPAVSNEEVSEEENNKEESNQDNNQSEAGQDIENNEKNNEDIEIDEEYSLPSEYNYDNKFELIENINEFINELDNGDTNENIKEDEGANEVKEEVKDGQITEGENESGKEDGNEKEENTVGDVEKQPETNGSTEKEDDKNKDINELDNGNTRENVKVDERVNEVKKESQSIGKVEEKNTIIEKESISNVTDREVHRNNGGIRNGNQNNVSQHIQDDTTTNIDSNVQQSNVEEIAVNEENNTNVDGELDKQAFKQDMENKKSTQSYIKNIVKKAFTPKGVAVSTLGTLSLAGIWVILTNKSSIIASTSLNSLLKDMLQKLLKR